MKRWRWLSVVGAVVVLTTAAQARLIRRASLEKAPAAASEEVYRSAILMHADSGTVLFEKDAHHQSPPASMTTPPSTTWSESWIASSKTLP